MHGGEDKGGKAGSSKRRCRRAGSGSRGAVVGSRGRPGGAPQAPVQGRRMRERFRWVTKTMNSVSISEKKKSEQA